MVFQDILNRKYKKLVPEFNKLLEGCYSNQTHPGDLLLIHQNGFYNPDVYNWNNIPEKLSPYCMGPGCEVHSEDTHYKFIAKYVNGNISELSSRQYLKSVEFNPENVKELEKLNDIESYSIQIEMLIYLKIWESDIFIKSFYQLGRILFSEPYDWHFKIKEKPNDTTATGSRGDIIRNAIRDRFKSFSPKLYNSFNAVYKSQVRNAIAHSQYIILGRTITLNNYKKGSRYDNIPSISFDKWIDIFHETIVLHSLYNKLLSKVLNIYEQIALQTNNLYEIRINREDPIISTEYRDIEYDPIFKYWR